jgi:hypothetical protein
VWYRVVQIVTNNEDVQEYAATQVFKLLKSSSCHENLIKVGGYVLGEFGHLIANEPGASPIEQFHALHSRSHLCSQSTRALLLSTYVKWLNLFPEIREQIMYVLNRYRHVLDAELQQRACEYVALASMENDELLQAVCDEMPPFSEKSCESVVPAAPERLLTAPSQRCWSAGCSASTETPATSARGSSAARRSTASARLHARRAARRAWPTAAPCRQGPRHLSSGHTGPTM